MDYIKDMRCVAPTPRVTLAIKYVKPHKRRGSRATFGNCYRVVAHISGLDVEVALTADCETLAAAEVHYWRIAREQGFSIPAAA